VIASSSVFLNLFLSLSLNLFLSLSLNLFLSCLRPNCRTSEKVVENEVIDEAIKGS
jgi:hypothetical protein